jgi:hypothetical protein
VSATLYDLDGRTVRASGDASEVLALRTDDLAAGLYVLVLRESDGKPFAQQRVPVVH